MFDVSESLSETLDGPLGEGAYIHLREEHPSHYRAARLLSTLGGSHCIMGDELMYEFGTTPARDEALYVVRRKLGWSVASPFDGGFWRSATLRRPR